VKGAAGGWVVGHGEVSCSGVSGKSLARPSNHQMSNHQTRRQPSASSPQRGRSVPVRHHGYVEASCAPWCIAVLGRFLVERKHDGGCHPFWRAVRQVRSGGRGAGR
jgi:hypothetical protein